MKKSAILLSVSLVAFISLATVSAGYKVGDIVYSKNFTIGGQEHVSMIIDVPEFDFNKPGGFKFDFGDENISNMDLLILVNESEIPPERPPIGEEYLNIYSLSFINSSSIVLISYPPLHINKSSLYNSTLDEDPYRFKIVLYNYNYESYFIDLRVSFYIIITTLDDSYPTSTSVDLQGLLPLMFAVVAFRKIRGRR